MTTACLQFNVDAFGMALWCAGPASDKDRSKPGRPQAFLPVQPHALYNISDAKSVLARAESIPGVDCSGSHCPALALVDWQLFCLYSFNQQPNGTSWCLYPFFGSLQNFLKSGPSFWAYSLFSVTLLSCSSDHQILRAVPPGPYATNLTEAVQAYNQVRRCGADTLHHTSVRKHTNHNVEKH